VDFLLNGWDSKVYLQLAGIASTLVDDRKGVFLWGDELFFVCVDYSVRKKFNLFHIKKEICSLGHNFGIY